METWRGWWTLLSGVEKRAPFIRCASTAGEKPGTSNVVKTGSHGGREGLLAAAEPPQRGRFARRGTEQCQARSFSTPPKFDLDHIPSRCACDSSALFFLIEIAAA